MLRLVYFFANIIHYSHYILSPMIRYIGLFRCITEGLISLSRDSIFTRKFMGSFRIICRERLLLMHLHKQQSSRGDSRFGITCNISISKSKSGLYNVTTTGRLVACQCVFEIFFLFLTIH